MTEADVDRVCETLAAAVGQQDRRSDASVFATA
jgi:hypothetical protein